MSTRTHQTFMRRAIRLAERGLGLTSPNPPVGAVVVADGEIVGEGWHRGPGLAHAEVEALEQAGARARGATLFVTLEPCTTHGRTPPCAPRILEAGVAAAVLATEDPNPAERGAGARALAAAGIDVTTGVLQEDANDLILGFRSWITTGRPLVVLKLATTLDGKVAAADGSSKWITGPTARRDAHRLRGWSDAVMVGVGTVLADDPALTCRLRGFAGRQPMRVVLDSSGRTPLEATVLDASAPVVFATTAKATEEWADAVRARGGDVARFASRDGRVDVASVLAELGRRDVTQVLVEGGPTVAGELIERGLVDRYVLYIAPKLLGALGTGAIAGLVTANIADARELTITGVRRVGADIKMEARPRI